MENLSGQLCNRKPVRCLIADDVRSTRKLLRSWLSDAGFQCTLVGDGASAWEVMRQQPHELVITDIQMHRGSGLELLHSIRNHHSDQIRETPVLVISGLQDCELKSIVRRCGGDGLLEEPLDKLLTYEAIRTLTFSDRCSTPFFAMGTKSTSRQLVSPTLRRLSLSTGEDTTTGFTPR